MLRITAPEQFTGRVVGIAFTEGVADVESVSRAARLYLATHGYRIEEAIEGQVSEGEYVVPADAAQEYAPDYL